MAGKKERDQQEKYTHLSDLKEGRSVSDFLSDRFMGIYQRRYDHNSDTVQNIEKQLAKARYETTASMFISRNLGIGLIFGVVLWAFVTIPSLLAITLLGIDVGPLIGIRNLDPLTLQIIQTIRTPAIVLISGILFGGIGFLIGYYTPLLILKQKIGSRKRKIDRLLPDTISYMYALSVGGMSQVEIFKAVADSEDVYQDVSEEFQTIIQESEYSYTDYRTAMRNRAIETPSADLQQFLTDMLSILDSGGDLNNFLEDKKEKHIRKSKENQEDLLEIVEMFGEMYMNLSLMPLLLIILLTIMLLMGEGDLLLLSLVIYILLPMIGVGFVILMTTVIPDEPGNGILKDSLGNEPGKVSVFDLKTVRKFKGVTPRFDQIYSKERNKRINDLVKEPWFVLTMYPHYTLVITLPFCLFFILFSILIGIGPTSFDALSRNIWGTLLYFYMPAYFVLIPLTWFERKRQKRRDDIDDNYSETLRKLSSANNTGQTFLEALGTVGASSTGRLSDELQTIQAKVKYNMPLKRAIVEFNNKYRIPQIARINNLIIDAQETSSQIGEVLTTAAQSSEVQDELKRARASRTRMQVAVIIMTSIVLLAVMGIMQSEFIGVMAELNDELDAAGDGGGGASFEAIPDQLITVLFFHAVTLQALTSSLLCSYLASNSLMKTGLYGIPLLTITGVVWILIA